MKAVIMACINCTSHLCIVRSNPYLPRWQLMVERLNLIESEKNAGNWLRKNTRLEHAFTGDCQKFDFDCCHNRYNYESEE